MTWWTLILLFVSPYLANATPLAAPDEPKVVFRRSDSGAAATSKNAARHTKTYQSIRDPDVQVRASDDPHFLDSIREKQREELFRRKAATEQRIERQNEEMQREKARRQFVAERFKLRRTRKQDDDEYKAYLEHIARERKWNEQQNIARLSYSSERQKSERARRLAQATNFKKYLEARGSVLKEELELNASTTKKEKGRSPASPTLPLKRKN